MKNITIDFENFGTLLHLERLFLYLISNCRKFLFSVEIDKIKIITSNLEVFFVEINAIGSHNYQNYSDIPKKVEKSSSEPIEEKSESKTTLSPDEVDAEIEKLKSKRIELKKSLQLSNDEDLQKQLNKIENELRLKNNDDYRKQHAKIISGVDLKI